MKEEKTVKPINGWLMLIAILVMSGAIIAMVAIPHQPAFLILTSVRR